MVVRPAKILSIPTSRKERIGFDETIFCAGKSPDQINRLLNGVTGIDRMTGNNTVVVFTSDHGWGMGEKDYLYKNSLWQESTQVPLIVRAPGVAQAGAVSEQPVSLIDLYPTLCELTGTPVPDHCQGKSLAKLLDDPEAGIMAYAVEGKVTGEVSFLSALDEERMAIAQAKIARLRLDSHQWWAISGRIAMPSRVKAKGSTLQ